MTPRSAAHRWAAACLLGLGPLSSLGCGGQADAPPAATAPPNIPPTLPLISTQPLSRTVTVGQTATFTVVASGTVPLSYQWKKNGASVGTNTASYTTPSTILADSGASFTVVVTNPIGSATSDAALLTVQAAPSTPIKVACVGDSITNGYGDSYWYYAYPHVLGRLLGSGYEVANFGRNSATMLDLLITDWQGNTAPDRYSYWNPRPDPATTPPYPAPALPLPNQDNQRPFPDSLGWNPAIVVIMLGTNDSKPEYWTAHKAEFKPTYLRMVQTYLDLPSHPKVFVALPCPAYLSTWGISDAAITEQLSLIQQVATEKHLPSPIDVHGALSNHMEYFVADGIHPNVAGKGVIAATVYAAITAP